MPLYVDTSALAAYYCPEAFSKKVELLISHDTPVISDLTEVELYSAIARKVRAQELRESDAVRILDKFRAHLDAYVFGRVSIESRHYRVARDWLGRMKTSLRTLDALHLAVAAAASIPILTCDKALSQAAKKIGVAVRMVS